MAYKEIRLLHADEIECRVAMVAETGVSLLLYKEAGCRERKLYGERKGTGIGQF